MSAAFRHVSAREARTCPKQSLAAHEQDASHNQWGKWPSKAISIRKLTEVSSRKSMPRRFSQYYRQDTEVSQSKGVTQRRNLRCQSRRS